MPSAKQVSVIIGLIGVGVLVGLTVRSGADLVGHAIIDAGWATVVVVVVRMASVAAAGVGWWALFPRELRPSVWACVLLRYVREATNALLPLAQIGGDFIGARCLALQSVKGTVAAASVIVDVLIQAATQLVFAIIGVVLLVVLGGNELLAWPIAIGIAIAIPALGGFFLLQGGQGQALVKKLLTRVAPGREWHVFGALDDLFAGLNSFIRTGGG